MFALILFVCLLFGVVMTSLGNSTSFVFLSPLIIIAVRSTCLYWEDSDRLVFIVRTFRFASASISQAIGSIARRRKSQASGSAFATCAQDPRPALSPVAGYDADERSFLINPTQAATSGGLTTRQFPLPRAATLAPPVDRRQRMTPPQPGIGTNKLLGVRAKLSFANLSKHKN